MTKHNFIAVTSLQYIINVGDTPKSYVTMQDR